MGFTGKSFVPVLSVDIIIKQCIEANKGLTQNNSHLQNNKEIYIYLHVNHPKRCHLIQLFIAKMLLIFFLKH